MAALLIAALICWFLGNALRKRSDRAAIDKVTGQEFTVNQSRHTLFFLPMHLWGPLLACIACVLFVLEFFG